MTKVTDFSHELAERYGLTDAEAADFITMMFDVVNGQLDAPDKLVKVKGLGTFKVTSVGARASVDVNTGERIILEGRNKVSFTPDVALRDRVNRPFVQFETVLLNDGVDFSDIDAEYAGNKNENEETPAEADVNGTDSSETKTSDDGHDDDGSRNVELSDEIIVNSSHADEVKIEAETDGNDNADDSVDEILSDETCVADVASEQEEMRNENHEHAPAAMVPPVTQNLPPNCKQRNPRLMYWLTAASFVLLVFIGVGMYFLYRQVEAKNVAIEQLQAKLAMHSTDVKAVPVGEQKQRAVVPVVVKRDTSLRVATKRDTPPHAATAEKPVAAAPMDYNYDVRIRTGAYIIVGTGKVVDVKAGQTLASISRANLGPGMECYVEVFNGCNEVKPGDKLKIPELKLKKLHKGQ